MTKWSLDANARRIVLEETPRRLKKLTGTRFATILGLNRWSTPFEAWCDITGVGKIPFEENMYTTAGKVIEPAAIRYCAAQFGNVPVISPERYYGADYQRMRFDFYKDEPIFGGMWDALLVRPQNNEPRGVVEIKTTKRWQDWLDGTPEYYLLQAALYAYLLKVPQIVMLVCLLSPEDYERPDAFVPSPENTKIRVHMLEEIPMERHIERALEWWEKHVVQGISPEYDEHKNEALLRILRTNDVKTPSLDIQTAVARMEALSPLITERETALAEYEAEADQLKKQIKGYLSKQLRSDDKFAAISGQLLKFELARSERAEIDKVALKRDGLFDKYMKPKETLTLRVVQA